MTATTSQEYGHALDDSDFEALEKSYITAEIAISARLRRVSSEEGKQIVGRRDFEDYAGIAFPYIWPGETRDRAHRIRRDNPPITTKRGITKPDAKYVSAAGWGNPLYFHPDTPASALTDVTVDLYIAEGQKKCLALYRLFRDEGMTAQPLAINGVWGHRGKTGTRKNQNGKPVKQTGPTPDLGRVTWTGRKAVIVFDTNVTTDRMVAAARNELALELTQRGAVVEFVEMEPEPYVNGIDDYLWLHGPEAGLDLLAAARPFNPSGKISKLPYSDYGNEQAFALLHGKDFLYNHTAKRWHIFNGVIWEPDLTGQADRAMLATAIVRLDSAAKVAAEQLKAATKAAFRLQSMKGRKPALESAQSNPAFAKRAEDFDQPEMLFACSNGVLNLATGEFGPGRRADLLSLQTNVEWNPIAEYPNWLKFLKEVFPEDTDAMITFLKRAIGYSMTASTKEEVFFILYGSGRNGKGTFLRVLSEVLGTYAYNTAFSTLLADNRNVHAPRNDVAAMAGKRFITAQESPEGAKLDEPLIKSLTGGDLVTARFLNKEFFTFKPTWKIWLGTNHKPEIVNTDSGIWSRPRLIPFTVSFEGKEDKALKQRLMQPSELSGILKWAFDGCREYVKDGLAYPKAVTDATAEYKSESDVLQRFIAECCVTGEAWSYRLRPLYKAFCDWGGSISEKAFSQRLAQKGYPKDRSNRGMVYKGIALQNPPSDRVDQDGDHGGEV